jgi:hypothetical protein
MTTDPFTPRVEAILARAKRPDGAWGIGNLDGGLP